MTYNELYRKVEGLWHDSFKDNSWKIVWDIVKLHEPFDFTWGTETETACKCGELWPCPTIQVIQEKLK